MTLSSPTARPRLHAALASGIDRTRLHHRDRDASIVAHGGADGDTAYQRLWSDLPKERGGVGTSPGLGKAGGAR